MGGGGGGGDYQAQQAQAEAKKQQARDALNLQFGVAPSSAAPSRDGFLTAGQWVGTGPDDAQAAIYVPERFDQAGYDKAMADWQGQSTTAAANKAAREALYSGVRDNAFTAGKRGLDEKRTSAKRDLKFELFANGLNGGSVDIDQNALLDRTYNQGVLDLGAKADAAAADMRGNDETTRLQLLQSIDAGMDSGSALSSALSQMRVNSDKAAASAQGTSLGDLFADSGALYLSSQQRKGKSDAAQALGALFATSPRAAGTGSSGILSKA